MGIRIQALTHEMFQKLQFKNMLSRFDVEAVSNDVEDSFREVTDQQEIEAVFAEAEQAECVGAAFSRDPGNVLPLFRTSVGIRQDLSGMGKDKIVSIPCDMDMDFGKLTERLSHLAER